MYTIRYHDKIPDDLTHISKIEKGRIRKAIEHKLTIDPVIFGKPLQSSLRGIRSTRVGEYRIIFLLQKKEVYIIVIGHRSVVYGVAQKRRAR